MGSVGQLPRCQREWVRPAWTQLRNRPQATSHRRCPPSTSVWIPMARQPRLPRCGPDVTTVTTTNRGSQAATSKPQQACQPQPAGPLAPVGPVPGSVCPQPSPASQQYPRQGTRTSATDLQDKSAQRGTPDSPNSSPCLALLSSPPAHRSLNKHLLFHHSAFARSVPSA